MKKKNAMPLGSREKGIAKEVKGRKSKGLQLSRHAWKIPRNPEVHDRIVRNRTRYTDMFEDVEARFSVMERAERVLSHLVNEHPYFLKCMLPSNVSHGFWLHLPKKFCSLHLLNHDSSMVLVDEWENEYRTSYLLRTWFECWMEGIFQIAQIIKRRHFNFPFD